MKRSWLLFLFVVTGALALQFTSGCAPTLPSGEVSDEKVTTDGGPEKAPQKDLCDGSAVCTACYDTNGQKITCPTTSRAPSCEFLDEGKNRTAQCRCPNGFKSEKVNGNLACQLYDSCTNYAQCRDGYICNSDGTCVVGCSDDKGKQCAAGLICYNKQCKRDCTSNPCQNNEACVKGVCLAAECGYGTLKCKAGQICSNKRCYATCSEEVKCANGFFCDTNKNCVPKCADDSSCKAGEICEPKNGDKQCVSAQCSDSTGCQGSKRFCNKGRCESTCKFDTACPAKQVCSEGKCVPGCNDTDRKCTTGQACVKSDESCSGNDCLRVCLVTCKVQADCKVAKTYCSEGVCREGCTTKDDCPKDKTYICTQKQCVAVQCTDSSQCAGKVCKANKCESCSDGECPGSDICVSGSCKAAAACTKSGDCKPGYKCTNKRCVEGCDTSDDCKRGETCTNGKCMTVVTCSSTSCPKGQYCASNGQCTSGCQKDIHCPSNQPKCDNGTCTIECVSNTQPVCLDGTLCKGFKCGTACTQDSECKDPTKICTTGKCVPRQCASSAACSGGLVCKSNRCVKCSADNDCGTGKRCSNGACVTPGTCSTKADCASGQVCDSGKCVECATAGDCPSAKPICDSNRCVECGDDSNCSGGKKCIAGACTDVTVVCSKDSDCATGQICTSNKCVAAQCSTSKLCPSGQVCLSGRCEAKCDPTKCVTGKVCDTVTNKCGDCTGDTDCGTGNVCDSGSCKKAPQKCTNTSDCTNPLVCKNGTCQTCLNNTDCANGEECKAGKCQAITAQCTQNSDCGNSGQICSSGKCVDCSADTDCGTGQYCATIAAVGKRCRTGCRVGACTGSQVCDPTTRVCVQCVADNDCSSAAGKFCVSNKCVVCKGDTDCAPGQVCQTNVCRAGGTACLSNADCKTGETCTNGRCQFFCNAQTTVCSTPGEICIQSNKCGPNTILVASPRKAGAHRLIINVGSNLYTGVMVFDWASGSQWSTTRVNKYRSFVKGKMVFTWPTDAKGDLLPLRVIPVIDGLGAQPCPPTSTTSRATAFASFADYQCNAAASSPGACTMFGLQALTGSKYGTSASISQTFGKCSPRLVSTTPNWAYYVPPSQP